MADPNPNPNPNPPVNPPAPVTPPADDSATSADVVKGKWANVIKGLENRINVLEDSNKTLQQTNKTYEEKLALLAKTPSKLPGKSLLQELDEFVFGPKPQA